MDRETLRTIAERYPWASWAVWSETFPQDDCVEDRPEQLVEFIFERAGALTSAVVLMGLNRSSDLPAPFSNFHATSNVHYDYRLKEVIQDGGLDRLHGAYMTDLVDEIDPDSHRVEVTDDDAAVLMEQLDLLDEPEYHIVCFGNKPFDGLIKYFDVRKASNPPEIKYATVNADGLILHLYRVWFYGLYGANQDKVKVFKRQLEELNQQIG